MVSVWCHRGVHLAQVASIRLATSRNKETIRIERCLNFTCCSSGLIVWCTVVLFKGDFCMAFKVAKSSLFAMLLRSPWWYSALIGLFFIGISLIIAGGQYVIFGVATSLPFFGIAGHAGYKQSQQPSQKRVLEVAQQVQKMRAVQIAEKIAKEYIDNGYQCNVFKGNAADLELTRGYRTILLCSKRSKVGNTGIEPLKQLVAAGENIEATGYLYVALGEISATAHDYAIKNNIEIIRATKLAAFFDGKVQIE
jgi:restriction system protein